MLQSDLTIARSLLLGLVVVTAATTAQAELGTLTDGELADADWTGVKLLDDTAAGDAEVQGAYRTAGGNPGGFRGLSNGWTHDGNGWSTVAGGHLRTVADFDPATDGPLGSLELEVDVITTQTTLPTEGVLVFFPVLLQGETYYAAGDAVDSAGDWARAHWGPLGAGDFEPIAGDLQGPAHPDFTASGGAIVFGVGAQSGPHVTAGLFFTEGGLDNWSLTLVAPSGAGGAGGVAGAGGSDGATGAGAGSSVQPVGPGTQPATLPDRSEPACTCRLGRSDRRGPAAGLWLSVALAALGCQRRRRRRG